MPMNLGLGLGLSRRAVSGAAPAFTPASVFTPGVEGVWSSRISTADLWQDTARTTPVTAVGQSVASWRVNKASGVEYMEEGVAANRPIYRIDANGVPYLEFDGSTDLLTSAGTFAEPAGSQESTMMVAVDWDGSPVDNAGFISYNGAFNTPLTHRAVGMNASGEMKVDIGTAGVGSGLSIPTTFAVLEGRFGSSVAAAVNGGAFTTAPGTANTPANRRVWIGRGLVGYAPGKYYGFLHIAKTLTTQERSDLVAWMTALGNP